MVSKNLLVIVGVVLAVFVFSACGVPEVTSEDVYRYEPPQPADDGLSSDGLEHEVTKMRSKSGIWVKAVTNLQELPSARDLRIRGDSTFEATHDRNAQVPVAITIISPARKTEESIFFLSRVSRSRSLQTGSYPLQPEDPEEGIVELPVICQERDQVYRLQVHENNIIYYPDVPGSQNIQISVTGAKFTEYAGLRFKQPVTVDIWDDGTIEVDEEGVRVTDNAGTTWVSQEVLLDDKSAVLLVREE